jgi:hypothetical protein
MLPNIAFFVALERRVWQALVDGDIEADTDLLDPQFLGVYASGFASRGDHAAQLADGPLSIHRRLFGAGRSSSFFPSATHKSVSHPRLSYPTAITFHMLFLH